MIARVCRAAVAAAAVVTCAALSVSSAGAAIFNIDVDPIATNYLPDIVTISSPSSTTATVDLGVSGSLPNTYRSPFAITSGQGNEGVFSDGPTKNAAFYEAAKYNSVRNGTGSITHSFVAGANKLEIIWGSPDAYNTLSFYNKAGVLIASLTGDEVAPPTAFGNRFVALNLINTPELFWSIVLTSTQAAFEYANLQAFGPGGAPVAETPIPPALVLFGSALLGLTMLGRRRRNARSVAA